MSFSHDLLLELVVSKLSTQILWLQLEVKPSTAAIVKKGGVLRVFVGCAENTRFPVPIQQ